MWSMKMRAMMHGCVLLVIFCAMTQAGEQDKRGFIDGMLPVIQSKTTPKTKTESKEVNQEKTVPPENKDIQDVPFDYEIKKNKQETTASTLIKREEESSANYKHTRLNRDVSALDLYLVEGVEKTPEKRTLSGGALPYNLTICYAFRADYTDPLLRMMVTRVLKYISSRLCVTYRDITATVNTSDSNWPAKNGCYPNGYILVANQGGCVSAVGADAGPRVTSPCGDAYIALHEFLHALGATHSQQDKSAASYISLLIANILTNYWSAYYPALNTEGVAVDAVSVLMYTDDSWTLNGDPTYYCMRSDFCNGANKMSTEDIIFYELNKRYKCKEVVCGNASVDCYPGYYAKIKGACQCECPPRRDPSTNCKTFINGPNKNVQWPTAATVMAAGPNYTCPAGMGQPGWISVCGNGTGADDSPVPFPKGGSTTSYLPFCSTTTSASTDFYNWQFGGIMCFVKPKESSCGGVFNLFTIEWTSRCAVQYNGTLGDITITGNRTSIRFCCKSEIRNWMIDLPNDQPFRLFTVFYCPYVRGMRVYKTQPSFRITDANVTGGPAKINYYNLSYGFYMDICYYVPPVYGCSVNTTLGISQKTVTITTPGYPSAREPNRRCFYCVYSTIIAFFKLTYNVFNLHADDQLMTNRYNEWQENSLVNNANPPKDMVSEGKFFCVEFWSGWKAVTNTGVNFTFETVLPGQLCYNYSTNGADYIGDKNISEYYEPCINWKDTLNCYESKYDATNALLGYFDGNACRNPGGIMTEPWCFVSENGTNCIKRNCDACDMQQPADALSTDLCTMYINTIHDFCTKAIQRYACAKLCNLTSVKADCPTGYDSYGFRCVHFNTVPKNRSDAEQACRQQGPGGTLFQIKNDDDNNFFRQYRYNIAGETESWISGTYDSGTKQWNFTDTSVPQQYFNFSAGFTTPTGTYCASLNKDKQDTTGKAGGWWAYSCSSTSVLLTFACQTDRVSTCGNPTPPPDGVITDPARPVYYEGDRLVVRCKYDNDTIPWNRTMVCKGGSWLKPTTACSECRVGWVKYKTRCTYYNTNKLLITDAENFCRAQGPNGTLFRIQVVDDHAFVRQQRRLKGNANTDYVYVSGRYQGNYIWFYTDSNNQQISYINMTTSNMSSCAVNNQQYIYKDTSSSTPGRAGSADCIDPAGNFKYNSMCQMDPYNVPAEKYTTCQAALASFPYFCNFPNSGDLCAASCLPNPDDSPLCYEIIGKNYNLTSAYPNVLPGEVMTYACKPGFIQTGGDTDRACSVDGMLLGQELRCESSPASLDVGLKMLTARNDYLRQYQAFLFDRDGYRVPIAGNITAWYCNSLTAANFTAIVFRKQRSTSSYTLVGYNTISCNPSWRWGIYIDPANQIRVQTEDVVGAWSAVLNTLSVTWCDQESDSSWQMPVATVNALTDLSTAVFSTTSCLRPSFGFQVQK